MVTHQIRRAVQGAHHGQDHSNVVYLGILRVPDQSDLLQHDLVQTFLQLIDIVPVL